jgi:hypothetical protein
MQQAAEGAGLIEIMQAWARSVRACRIEKHGDGMRISEITAVAALMLLSQIALPVRADPALPYLIAQAEKPADSAAAPAPAAGAPQEGTAMKSAISTPACYVKFLETKVAGKLNGKKWTEYRRDVCGEHETTAVFPTVIAPKYTGETDLDKARTKTCAEQFTANKAANANGGLKWVEKDGGYYAECINRLKEG